jgi:hypothetical protein
MLGQRVPKDNVARRYSRTLLVTVLVALLVGGLGAQIRRGTPRRDQLGHNRTETDNTIKRAIEAKLRTIVLFHKSRDSVLIRLILEITLNVPLSTQDVASEQQHARMCWKALLAAGPGCAGPAGSLVVKPGQ